jgi:hypothetical protein
MEKAFRGAIQVVARSVRYAYQAFRLGDQPARNREQRMLWNSGRTAMNRTVTGVLLATLVFSGKAFAAQVDQRPVHIHTQGSIEILKLVVDRIVRDADGRVTQILAHRNEGGGKFAITVAFEGIDNKTGDLVETALRTGVMYRAHIEKLDSDWKLLKLSNGIGD